jgi:hypothetical protein
MPRLFFDLDDGTTRYADTTETELSDLTTVRSEATRFLATVFKDTTPDSDRRTFVVKVRDIADRIIFTRTLTLQEDWTEVAGMDDGIRAQGHRVSGQTGPGVQLITKPFTMDQLGSREVGLPKACSLPGPRWSNRPLTQKNDSIGGVARLTAPLLPFKTKAWRSHGAPFRIKLRTHM